MGKAVEEEVERTGSRDLTVSGDGTWQKRGHTSKNGVVTLIGVKSGKAIDTEVLSTSCQVCNLYKGPKEGEEYEEWLEAHQGECSKNHDAAAGMVEVSGMTRIFERSKELYKVRYKEYIGKGDTKTFKTISEIQPYGRRFKIEKVFLLTVLLCKFLL